MGPCTRRDQPGFSTYLGEHRGFIPTLSLLPTPTFGLLVPRAGCYLDQEVGVLIQTEVRPTDGIKYYGQHPSEIKNNRATRRNQGSKHAC
eukprot:6466459-Amphidinium_carterae.1